jgi:DNA-directed RNA polymerase specialized sigma24 family protein
MLDRLQLDRWMAAAADGDRTAIDPLFQALWPISAAYASRFLGDPVLAEDCAQEALVKLFGQLPRYDRERDALTWTLTHVTWQCRTARRKLVRRGEVGDDALAAGSYDGAAVIEERELVRAALATMSSLAPRDIEVLVAVLVDDDELRRAIAPATFRKRLERALTRLRTSWRSRHGTL